MTEINLTVNGVELTVFGTPIAPEPEVGIMGDDFDISDIMHEGKSIYDILSEQMIDIIIDKCIEYDWEFKENFYLNDEDFLKED